MNQIKSAAQFPTSFSDILERISSYSPLNYAKTRNFIDGEVSYLSPYISRGVMSTKQVAISMLNRGFNPNRIEKFIQELAWRDYWQLVWKEKGDQIDHDLKQNQPGVLNHQIPTAVIKAETGIDAIDASIASFYQTGYLHNHVRMYIASIVCNIAGSHWKIPAKWMYYHLLDADWASNALSWQWVAGSNSHKKYFANQDNINKYCRSNQRGTFLDRSYESFDDISVPDILVKTSLPTFNTPLPNTNNIVINPEHPTLIYNIYNLDPRWRTEKKYNRILLLEPSVFNKYPISEKTLEFILDLAVNIPELKIYTGEFDALIRTFKLTTSSLFYKEHPLNSQYKGNEDQRDWMFETSGYFPSFFSFWKKAQKEMYKW